VGSARQAAGATILAGVAFAFAMAAPVAFAAGPAPAAAARHEPIAFAGLPWGAAAPAVNARLARLGFRSGGPADGTEGGPTWRGRWRGERATCTTESRPGHGLVAVTLRFDPATLGDALQLYERLGADLRRRYGPEDVSVGPGRSVTADRSDPRLRLVMRDDLVGARFWTGADDAALALQLDGRHVVWLRWEAPGWSPEAAPDER
jgi:hypothetical protein